jgi:hypothetical protein
LVLSVISKCLNFKLMAPPKIMCLFSEVFRRECSFVINVETDVNKVRCSVCKNSFSVGHGSKNCVQKSIRADKNKLSLPVSVKHSVK